MWRRAYLVLLVVRLFFALSPSYIHPDEFFQGPEVIAGEIFGYPSIRTWEWTVAQPIRSVFPLWLTYGIPMSILQAMVSRDGTHSVSPKTIYYTMRLFMFMLSFVLEDWAIHELVHSPQKRKQAVVLVASSYVTWTYQTHTFSNSIETLLVLWSLVLMERIAYANTRTKMEKPAFDSHYMTRRSYITANMTLGFLLAFGLFNRITFPVFLLIPGIQLLPHLWNRPLALAALSLSFLFFTLIAITMDTAFYSGPEASISFRALFAQTRSSPVITPINNLLYNTKTANLAHHGLHARYQHLLANLPQLLGPAIIPLIIFFPRLQPGKLLGDTRLTSAIGGLLGLSIFPHQEARFLLPCVALLLTTLHLPKSQSWRRCFWITWIVFNAVFGILMGVYHQGGVVSAQLALPQIINSTSNTASNVEVYWWKTYPPPNHLLGPPLLSKDANTAINITEIPILGHPEDSLADRVTGALLKCHEQQSFLERLANTITSTASTDVFLAAPLSAWRKKDPDRMITIANQQEETFSLVLHRSIPRHINLDDMDFGDDGIRPTLSRVIGRGGLGIWKVTRDCSENTVAVES